LQFPSLKEISISQYKIQLPGPKTCTGWWQLSATAITLSYIIHYSFEIQSSSKNNI